MDKIENNEKNRLKLRILMAASARRDLHIGKFLNRLVNAGFVFITDNGGPARTREFQCHLTEAGKQHFREPG